jgi:acylphosphatase
MGEHLATTEKSGMSVTFHLRITGRVQGVGYRDALRAEALRRGVTGWVRNRADGSVEALVQGAPEAVEAVLTWARTGPSAARVTGVDARPPSPDLDRRYDRFDWLPSA